MEKNFSNSEKPTIANLKQLPPIDPNISSSQNELEVSKPRSMEATKSLDDSSFGSRDCREFSTTAKKKSEGGSAKSRLFEICAANKWKPPLFECCQEEGPSHMKLFTFKAIVEIKEASNIKILECFSAPQSRKKIAVENAAEGVLWYLKHLS